MLTIGGFTEAELDAQRAVQDNAAAADLARLKIVAERGRSAVEVDATEQQRIAAQQSLGARPAHGGQSPADEIRRARLEAFQNSDAATIPGLIRQERAGAVTEAERKLAELRGGLVQQGDAAEEMRNDRLLARVRTRLGEDAPVTAALAELERYAGNRNELGLVSDELRARFPKHGSLIDQHLGRLDPQLAAAETEFRSRQHDFTVIDQVASAVEKGIQTGNMPSSSYFENVAQAVKRQ
jgi:hypothetical protein